MMSFDKTFLQKNTIRNHIVVILLIKETKPILHLAMYFSALILFCYSFITKCYYVDDDDNKDYRIMIGLLLSLRQAEQ